MDSDGSAVYCTILLSDQYLPGAMVLAHSLHDNGTKARLVALFTPDTLQPATVDELRTVYDELIPVHSILNRTPANLWLMERPDLIATFTKVELWRLTQYRRIVYIDCDVVAVRAPDELLSLEADFAAAPDVGWPDCFNSGMMVLRPNLQDYYALKALAERGISFDGADQGLLNMHFRNWHRLSFTYNCTPSANYQYIPAYNHFQSTISLIHFIGLQKPWNLPRQVVPLESPYNQLLGRWWAVYDKHYRPPFVSTYRPRSGPPPPQAAHEAPAFKSETGLTTSRPAQTTPHPSAESTVVQHEQWVEPQQVHRTDESGPVSFHDEEAQRDENASGLVSTITEPKQPDVPKPDQEYHAEPRPAVAAPVLSVVPQYVRGEELVSTYISPLPHPPAPISHIPPSAYDAPHEAPPPHHPAADHGKTGIRQPQPITPIPAMNEPYHRPPSPAPSVSAFEAPQAEWDASREPPPVNTKPEGIGLQQRTYMMSEDTQLFQPPPSYPEAPKNMYYQVPTTKPESKNLTQLFPWESRAPKPTRVFANELAPPDVSSNHQAAPSRPDESESTTSSPHSRVRGGSPSDSWDTYTRSNAWDEDPEIQRYIETIQQARRGKTQVISGSGSGGPQPSSSSNASGLVGPSGSRPSVKLTDFPSEVERPSLPVTPAPIRRSTGDGDGEQDDDASHGPDALPAAEGVPSQEDWNPLARLEELRRRQSAVLENPAPLLSRLSLLSESSSSSSPSPSSSSSSSAMRRLGAQEGNGQGKGS